MSLGGHAKAAVILNLHPPILRLHAGQGICGIKTNVQVLSLHKAAQVWAQNCGLAIRKLRSILGSDNVFRVVDLHVNHIALSPPVKWKE